MSNSVKSYDTAEYRRYTTKAELCKAINMLRGMVAGISSDGKILPSEVQELTFWCDLHQNLRSKHPFSELLPMIQEALEDGVLDPEEQQDILWVCSNFTDEAKYYDLNTATIQFLHGLVHGIMSDGTVNDIEIHNLSDWLDENDFLRGTYPFDELDSLVHTALADGFISEDERAMLTAFFSNIIDFKDSWNLNESDFSDLRKKYSIDGICALCPDIEFEEKVFCFTGASYKGTRAELVDKITALGGEYRPGVSKKTDYLVVGNAGNPCWSYSCYGRKIEAAVKLRKMGAKVQIINETDFWDAVLAAE